MSFESPHVTYEFSADTIVREDFMPELNYAILAARDAQKMKNRYLNSCHYLGSRLGEFLTVIQAENLMTKVIIVIAGSHCSGYITSERIYRVAGGINSLENIFFVLSKLS